MVNLTRLINRCFQRNFSKVLRYTLNNIYSVYRRICPDLYRFVSLFTQWSLAQRYPWHRGIKLSGATGTLDQTQRYPWHRGIKLSGVIGNFDQLSGRIGILGPNLAVSSPWDQNQRCHWHTLGRNSLVSLSPRDQTPRYHRQHDEVYWYRSIRLHSIIDITVQKQSQLFWNWNNKTLKIPPLSF